MKFIQKSLGQLSKVSASTPIKSAANGILGYMELENSNETEIYNLINENFSKYSTDKNVSMFLNAVKNYKKGKNLGISESLNKILASNKNIDGDLKFTVVDLQESLGTYSEGKMASKVLNRLKPFRWNMVTNEAIDTIEKSVKENGILSMLNDTIDALLEDEASNANAIATITQAYHLPETDIRHYLLSQFSGKAGIYPVVDDLLKTLVATGDNLDVETIKYNIDSTGRYSTSIPVSPVIQEGKRKLFMLKNRIFESLNGKIRLVESVNRVPEKFLELCNAFTKVKFDESKKTMILESRNNTMAICEDTGGEGYQIQLNGSNLGSDMTTYESEIQGMGADLGIPQDDINSFVCLAGNFKSIAMLDGVVSVEVNDVVSLDIIKADGGIYLAVYNKASDEMNLVNSQDTSAVDAIENEYNVDVHEFLNEDDEENIDGTADAGVDGGGADGGGAETDTNAALEVALKELEDQLEETSENLDKLDALEDDYKDDSINELIERMQNTKDQLQAEIEEIRVKLGGGGTTNEVAAKAMVDLESVISASVDGNDIEDSTFKNGETTSVNDAITITPVVEFIKTDDKIQIGGIFIRVDSTDENGDIESTLAGKFDNVVDGNMIPILDEIVEINFEGLAALQGKIDEIISKLEKDGDTPPTDDAPAEEPNESKLVLERKKFLEAKSEKMYVITKERNGRETEFIGTVKELTKDFSYTLLLAAEARVKGINQNPTTITQLISSLEKAYDYTEGSSYNRTSLRWRENGKVETSESADGLEGVPSTTKGKTLIYKPVANNPENQVAISKKFDEFVDYLKKNYKNGDEFSMNVNGDYVINNKVLLKDLELFKMANVITTDVENEPEQINESSEQEIVYMAPANRKSLEKYNEKIAKIINDTDDMLTIEFEDGKQLTSVPKTQVRFIGSKTNESSDENNIIATKVETDESAEFNPKAGDTILGIFGDDVKVVKAGTWKDVKDVAPSDHNASRMIRKGEWLEDEPLVAIETEGKTKFIYTLRDLAASNSKIAESKINESQIPLFVFSTAIGAWTTFFVDAMSTDSQEISDKISDAYDEAPGTYKVYDTKEFDGYKFIWCECASANDYNIIVVTPDNSNNAETLQKIKTVLETNKNELSAGSYFLDEAIGGEYVGNLHGLYESNGSEFNGFKILTGKEAEEKMTKLYNTGASTDSDDDKVFGIYSESPEKWIAFDNTSGEGNVELFASETEAMKWIKGEEAIPLFIPESLDGGNSVSRSSFAQVWDELYSEDFAAEYSELYNKLPKSLSFGDFVILWNETYNEDFVKEYPRFSRKFTVCSEYPEFTAFVKELYEKYDLNFHPDDSFADYVGHDDQPTFTDAQAKEFDDKMDSFVETIDDDDLYDVLYQIQRELGIGFYQISEAKKVATDVVKTVKRGRKPDAINVKIRKQLAKGNTITEIAKSLGLKYQRVKNVKKRDDKKKVNETDSVDSEI